jgi:hypothetical protein
MGNLMMISTKDFMYDTYYKVTDPRMDGFYCFANKQKLYEIKWLVDSLLSKCPTFVGEEEFVKENRSKYESAKG